MLSLCIESKSGIVRIVQVSYSHRFLKAADRLPKDLLELAQTKESLFRESHHHPSLRTHKLHGRDAGSLAFWINQKYRIKFIFISDTHVLFLDIGTHDVYR